MDQDYKFWSVMAILFTLILITILICLTYYNKSIAISLFEHGYSEVQNQGSQAYHWEAHK